MSQTIISLIHCLQGKIDVTNVTHTWYLCFLCTTRGPHTQFLMAFSNYILQFYIWYELVHSFTSSQAKDKSCYREAKNTFLPKWNIVWKAVPLKRREATCEYKIFYITVTHTHTHSLPLMQTISQSLAHSLFFFNAHSSLTHTPSLTVSHKLHFSHFHTDTLSIFL